MARPAVAAVAEHWYDELAVTQPADEAHGWAFLILLGAMGVSFGEVHDLVRDTDDGSGWSSLLDPDRCPVFALPWLAQFAGVQLPDGLSEAEQRRRIDSPAPYARGTRDAMIAAAQATLTGTKTVRLVERAGSPWRIAAITRPAETDAASYNSVGGTYDGTTGSYDSTAKTAVALLSQKPAGLILTHIVTDLPIVEEGARTFNAAPTAVNTATVADVS